MVQFYSTVLSCILYRQILMLIFIMIFVLRFVASLTPYEEYLLMEDQYVAGVLRSACCIFIFVIRCGPNIYPFLKPSARNIARLAHMSVRKAFFPCKGHRPYCANVIFCEAFRRDFRTAKALTREHGCI